MHYVISHQDAYWLWYNAGPDYLRSCRRSTLTTLDGAAGKARDLARFDLSPIATALVPPPELLEKAIVDLETRHALVPTGTDGRQAKGFARHRWKGKVPKGSLVVVGQGILACSPELCLMQLSRELSTIEFMRWAMALCGCYHLEQGKAKEREPVTSVARITAMLDGCSGHWGSRSCRQALRYMRDGARSPKEIELYLMLCLPSEMGGYGLDGSVLNWRRDLKDEAEFAIADRPDRRYVEGDICWPDQQVVVEYLGKDHDDTLSQDRRRTNMMQALGLEVVQVDRWQMRDPALVDVAARTTAHHLGRDLPEQTQEWLARRGMLRETLLGAGRIHM